MRRLKSAKDPVTPSSSTSLQAVSKVTLAQVAWREQCERSIEFPRLHTTLLGWTLDALAVAGKAGASGAGSSSVLRDLDYWLLLGQLLSVLNTSLTQTLIASIAPRCSPQAVISSLVALLQLQPVQAKKCVPLAAKPLQQLMQANIGSLAANQNGRATIDEAFEAICFLSQSMSAADAEVAEALLLMHEVLLSPWLEASVEAPTLAAKVSREQ